MFPVHCHVDIMSKLRENKLLISDCRQLFIHYLTFLLTVCTTICLFKRKPISAMNSFREVRDILLVAHSENLINDEELVLLYDLNTSNNIDLPYWSYDEFDLDMMSDDECRSEFRFLKNDIFHLAEILHIPNQVRYYNRIVVDGIESLCIFLKRFAYPCRYADILRRFARPVPQLCMISNEIINFIYQTQHHRLRSFDQPWQIFKTMLI